MIKLHLECKEWSDSFMILCEIKQAFLLKRSFIVIKVHVQQLVHSKTIFGVELQGMFFSPQL